MFVDFHPSCNTTKCVRFFSVGHLYFLHIYIYVCTNGVGGWIFSMHDEHSQSITWFRERKLLEKSHSSCFAAIVCRCFRKDLNGHFFPHRLEVSILDSSLGNYAHFAYSATRSTTNWFSTQRQHDDCTCAQMIWDLRWDLRQYASFVVMKFGQTRLIENNRTCASSCALTSTSFCQHKIGSNDLLHTWSCRRTRRFPQSKGSGYCCTRSRICSPLRSLPQSVKLEYSRFAPALQVSQCWPRILNTAAEASSVRASQPRCTSHGSIPWSHSTDSHKSDTCLLQRMIKQSDALCLLQSTCCVCVNSLIPLCLLQLPV